VAAAAAASYTAVRKPPRRLPNTVIHTFIYTHTHTRVPYRRVRVAATRFPAEHHFGGCHAVRALPGKLIYQREHPRAPKS